MSTGDDKWLRAMLQSAPAERTAACLDAERLAAWSDGALTAHERTGVELHLSTCAHCMAAAAALQRTAPTTEARRRDGTVPAQVFDRSRLFRWLVPITAAATAVAIWVAVPDRQRPVQELPSASRAVVPESARQTPPAPQPEAVSPPSAGEPQAAAGPQAQAARDTYSPVPGVGNRARERSASRADSAQLRDEVRQRTETDTLAKAETSDLARQAQLAEAAAAPPPAAAVPEAPPAETSATAKAERSLGGVAREPSADASFRSAVGQAFAPTVSMSRSDPSAGWRLANAGATIERSTDGGRTWAPIPHVPGVSQGSPGVTITSIRAVDARRAVARTSDGRQFYTTDSGASWTQVQENQTAPF